MCHELSHKRLLQSTGDPSLIFRSIPDIFEILSGTCVDDLLQAATSHEHHAMQTRLQPRLDVYVNKPQNLVFIGIESDRRSNR